MMRNDGVPTEPGWYWCLPLEGGVYPMFADVCRPLEPICIEVYHSGVNNKLRADLRDQDDLPLAEVGVVWQRAKPPTIQTSEELSE